MISKVDNWFNNHKNIDEFRRNLKNFKLFVLNKVSDFIFDKIKAVKNSIPFISRIPDWVFDKVKNFVKDKLIKFSPVVLIDTLIDKHRDLTENPEKTHLIKDIVHKISTIPSKLMNKHDIAVKEDLKQIAKGVAQADLLNTDVKNDVPHAELKSLKAQEKVYVTSLPREPPTFEVDNVSMFLKRGNRHPDRASSFSPVLGGW